MQNQATTTIQLLIKDVSSILNAIGTHMLEMDKRRTMTSSINVHSILPSRNVACLFCVCLSHWDFPTNVGQLLFFYLNNWLGPGLNINNPLVEYSFESNK